VVVEPPALLVLDELQTGMLNGVIRIKQLRPDGTNLLVHHQRGAHLFEPTALQRHDVGIDHGKIPAARVCCALVAGKCIAAVALHQNEAYRQAVKQLISRQQVLDMRDLFR